MTAKAEFTVEPFVEGDPGPHVTAAIDAVRDSGLVPDMGPFGTSVTGEVDHVVDAVAAAIRAAAASGAERVSVQVTLTSPPARDGTSPTPRDG
jgi:uncharacterized protein YqgV (UPF0045/DUF77 family)